MTFSPPEYCRCLLKRRPTRDGGGGGDGHPRTSPSYAPGKILLMSDRCQQFGHKCQMKVNGSGTRVNNDINSAVYEDNAISTTFQTLCLELEFGVLGLRGQLATGLVMEKRAKASVL